MERKIKPIPSLKGDLSLPPDKSISQRAAIFSLLHEGRSEVKNCSMAEDPLSTLACVEHLGAKVQKKDDVLIIEGTGRTDLNNQISELDCGNSGTCMRLLSGVVVGAGLSIKLTGDSSLSSRSMKRIMTPMEMMGAKILAANNQYAPLHISRSGELNAIEYKLPVASAQVKSCVLLAGLFGKNETKVIETTPSRDHTERLLNLNADVSGDHRIISSSANDAIPNQSYSIPADFSSAAFWLVGASIQRGSEIRLKQTGLNPTRTGLMSVLKDMGANIEIENESNNSAEPTGDIIVRSSDLIGTRITKELIPNCIDELPILSIAMAYADGTSIIEGAEELRHKETDRIMAISQLLKSINADFEELQDGLIIHGKPDHTFESATFESFHDHRIAMAAAILSLKGRKASIIKDAECAAISYPSFWEHLDTLSN